MLSHSDDGDEDDQGEDDSANVKSKETRGNTSHLAECITIIDKSSTVSPFLCPCRTYHRLDLID